MRLWSKDFNPDQREFLNSMQRGFESFTSSSTSSQRLFLLVIGVFIAFVLVVAVIHYRRPIIGRFKYWGRVLSGSANTQRKRKSLEVAIQVPRGPDPVVRTNTINVSPNGMYVKLNPPFSVGEVFKFRLALKGNRAIVGQAEVVWVQPRWSEHHPTGMGCKFQRLSQEEKLMLSIILRPRL